MAVRQFRISEATALSVRDTLLRHGIEATLKWPNDIYVGDRKICGILIEHTLTGNRIDNSRCGVGINLNQREFRSDAPNPVSAYQLLGHELHHAEVLEEFSEDIEHRLQQAATDPEGLHAEYLSHLWRADNEFHSFRHRGTQEAPFRARIVTVHPDGLLELQPEQGDNRRYSFKEVEFMLI